MHGDDWAQFVRRSRGDMARSVYARQLGVARATLIRWEEGQTVPNDPEIIRRVGRLSRTGEEAAMVAAGLIEQPTEADGSALKELLQDPDNKRFWDATPNLPKFRRMSLLVEYIKAREEEAELRDRDANRQRRAGN